MLKLIVGTKGAGKTKTMIEMIDKATKRPLAISSLLKSA